MGRPVKYVIDEVAARQLIEVQHLSVPLAAKQLGVPYDALRGFIERYGIKVAPSSQRLTARTSAIRAYPPNTIQQWLNEGCTYSDIAERCGCTENAVVRYVQCNGLSRQSKSDIDVQLVKKLYSEDGFSISEVAATIHVSEDRVRNCLQRNSIQRTDAQKATVQKKRATAKFSKYTNLPDKSILAVELQSASMASLSRKYQVPYDILREYVSSLKLSSPRSSVINRDKLQQLLDAGYFVSEIAEMLSKSEATVSKYIHKFDLVRSSDGERTVRQRRVDNARNNALCRSNTTMPSAVELQALVDAYYNYAEIADKLKCSESYVGKLVNQFRIHLPSDYNEKVIRRYVNKGKQTVIDRYGVWPYALSKYSDVAKCLLTDKQALVSYLKGLSLNERTISRVSSDLDVPSYLVQAYVRRYNLQEYVSPTLGSSLEEQIRRFLDNEGVKYERNNRTILKPRELDFYIPDKSIAIEVNGTWAHSVDSVGTYTPVSRLYHQQKSQACSVVGVRLIHLFEYELSGERWKLIRQFLSNSLQDKRRIGARQCTIREVSVVEERQFLSQYHLQGYVASTICYGLYHEEELLQLMSFGRPRFSSNYEWELLRLCTKYGYVVTGGAEKLFKYFTRCNAPMSVVSYCDLSKFSGNVYSRIGMELDHISQPNYRWVRYSKVYSRYQCQKHKLAKLLGEQFDSSKSEAENMLSAGYVRVYDSGNAVYVWRESAENLVDNRSTI